MTLSYTRKYIAAALALAFLLCLPNLENAHADDAKVLDHAGLKAMLENLGYEPKERKYGSGSLYYRIEPKLNGRTWYFNVRAPKNSRYIYVQLDFGKYPSETSIPRQGLIELLKENGKTTYSSFFIASWGGFMLTSNLVNRNVKPVDIRRAIEEMMPLAAKTEKYWNSKKWSKGESSPADAKKKVN
ncbi:MAG: hypothetical protein MPJ78_15800 [Hyphomicrobiaceae bacterium]|nr:hypothetical protein [Hyphomicrobiaceae bacterium]